jgi:hypothetical protein
MAYRDHPKEHWEAALKEIEKKSYSKQEAKDLYKEGKIKNGQIFIIKGAETATTKDLWVAAVFLSGKMFYTPHSKNDRRLDTLKMKSVAHLLEIVKTGWSDTRQAPWLPPRLQNIKNPDLVIHGAKSNDRFEQVLGDGKGERVDRKSDTLLSELDSVKSEYV